MDPTQCLKNALEALARLHKMHDTPNGEQAAQEARDAAMESLDHLTTWLDKDGFGPHVFKLEDLEDTFSFRVQKGGRP